MLKGSRVIDLGNNAVFQMRDRTAPCSRKFSAVAVDCKTAVGYRIETTPKVSAGFYFVPAPIVDKPYTKSLRLGFVEDALEYSNIHSLSDVLDKAALNDIPVNEISELTLAKLKSGHADADIISRLCKIHYPDSAGARP